MSIQFDNNASATLSVEAAGATPGPEDTTIVLQAAEGLLFPPVTTASGDFFYVTLEDTAGNIEILKCTNVATDTLTVARAQENTSSLTFAVGSKAELRTTAGVFAEFIQRTGGLMTGTLDMNGQVIQDPVITTTGAAAIRGIAIQGADGGTANELVVPTAGGAVSIGVNTIVHTGNDTAYVKTTRTLTGSDGITAIGDLSTNRLVKMDVNALPALAGTDLAATDKFVVYDASAVAHKGVAYQSAGIPIISNGGATVTPTDAQMNSMFLCTNATSCAFTLAAGNGEKGNVLIVRQETAAGRVTVTPSGVTITSASGLITRTQYSVIILICTATNVWTMYGDSAVA